MSNPRFEEPLSYHENPEGENNENFLREIVLKIGQEVETGIYLPKIGHMKILLGREVRELQKKNVRPSDYAYWLKVPANNQMSSTELLLMIDSNGNVDASKHAENETANVLVLLGAKRLNQTNLVKIGIGLGDFGTYSLSLKLDNNNQLLIKTTFHDETK